MSTLGSRFRPLSIFFATIFCLLSSPISVHATSWIQDGGILDNISSYMSFAINPDTGEKYIAYQDSSTSKLSVKKFDGAEWVVVGTESFSANRADYVSLAFNPATFEPYVAYREVHADGQGYQTYSNLHLVRFDGSSWVDAVTPEVYATGVHVGRMSLAFNPSTYEPYVAYDQYTYTSPPPTYTHSSRVRKLTGSTWSDIGSGNLFSGTGIQEIKIAFNPSTNDPYVTFIDFEDANTYKVNTKVFDGSSWNTVGSSGFSVGSGKTSSISFAFNPSTNQPFVVYADPGDFNKAYAMEFDGSSWNAIGTAGFNDGYGSGPDGLAVAFNPANDMPYVMYPGGVSKFNGTSWVPVGGSSLDPISDISLVGIAFDLTTNQPSVVSNRYAYSFSEPFDRVELPVASLPGDMYTGAQTTDLSSATAGVAIYYTTDGSTPTISSTQYTGSIPIASSATLKAIAVKSGLPDSDVMSEDYLISSWVAVGDEGFTPRQTQNIKIAFNPSADEPYVSYMDHMWVLGGPYSYNQSVKKFNSGTGNWDGVGAEGFNLNRVDYGSLAFHPVTHEPYLSMPGSNSIVSRYDGSNWIQVGGSFGNFSDNTKIVFNPVSNELYVVGAYYSVGAGKITVKKFDGTSWSPVGTEGFSVSDISRVGSSDLAFDTISGDPYVIYSDAELDSQSVVQQVLNLKKFDGTSWVTLSTSTLSAYEISLVFEPVSNSPYVFNNGLKKFNGTSFDSIGPAITGAGKPKLMVDQVNNEFYVGYTEWPTNTGYLKKFNGTTWDLVGGTTLSSGDTQSVDFAFNPLTNEPYVAYTDSLSPFKATVKKLPIVQVETPIPSVASGTFTSDQSIILTSPTPEAFVYYSTDGSTPTAGSVLYGGAISVSESTILKAIAIRSGYTNSAIMTETYTITTPAAPSVTTGSASSITATTVTLGGNLTDTGTANVTERGIVYGLTTAYEATSSASSAGFSTGAYTEDITGLTCNTIYHFTAYALNSVGTAQGSDDTFTTAACPLPQTATPTASPAGGSFSSAQSVTLSTTTSGALIFYTTDGSTPATTTSTQYTGAISISSSQTLKAIAWTSGYTDSSVMSEDYVIAAATPVASPAGGTFTSTQTVSLTSTTGGTIYYTTDGSTPATTTSQQYIGAISISSSETLKAIAWASGYVESAVMTEVYTITDQDVLDDKAALVDADILGSNADVNNILTSLAALPSSGSVRGSTITWLSDATGVVSNDGQTITRPTFSLGDQTVNLTATISKGASSVTKTFVLAVIKAPASTVATVTSNTYTVSAGATANETIINIPYKTAKSVFLSAVTRENINQTLNTTAVNNPVKTGDILVVTAEDGTTQVSYMVSVRALTSAQTVPDSGGVATVNATTPEVVVTDLASTSVITVSSGTTNATINLGSFIANGTGTIPAIQITSSNAYNAGVNIPASTVVTSASTTWNGVISAPTVTSVTLPTESGVTKTLSTAIVVGFIGERLTFDKAVRLLVPNEAGKRAGYIVTSTFVEITDVCSSDSQSAGNALVAEADCKVDVGSDLVIWTKHFTTFATYSQTTNSSGGGGRGGGSGSSSSKATTVAVATSTTAVPVVPTAPTETPISPTVSSATTLTLNRNLILGDEGEDVRSLQKFLNAQGFIVALSGLGSVGNETTYFGAATKAAVIKYQNAHAVDILTPAGLISGTGYVGPSTRTYMGMEQVEVASTQPTSIRALLQLLALLQEQLRVLLEADSQQASLPASTVTSSQTPASQTSTPSITSVPVASPVNVTVPVQISDFQTARTLGLGMVGEDVRTLQKILNWEGFIVAQSGVGSKGNEATYYDSQTQSAVTRYQEFYKDELNLSKGTGYVDAVTRAHMGF
ncbi:MAG: chitobiase/beta-hexosaminidase C-terminal domain-containing protein [Candidatus Pacebacteria bacterium]|nr:chitobiase/beta-hexosaminidase C-terminal domain-containing protein [Candidatus Paceibacterota bacterium]MCF7857437.1 chitobiase/beta-hexosaminidase C-terminal domain-containing protein [Candidatus Paceibacterota bacterium]